MFDFVVMLLVPILAGMVAAELIALVAWSTDIVLVASILVVLLAVGWSELERTCIPLTARRVRLSLRLSVASILSAVALGYPVHVVGSSAESSRCMVSPRRAPRDALLRGCSPRRGGVRAWGGDGAAAGLGPPCRAPHSRLKSQGMRCSSPPVSLAILAASMR
jgi:hypothetical protein